VASAPPSYLAGALVLLANVLALTSSHLPLIGGAIGFWFLVIYPAYLLYSAALWQGCPPAERVGYSIGAVLLLLMLGGLTMNTVLPLLGVTRPLDTLPVIILGDLVVAALYALRQRRPGEFRLSSLSLSALRPRQRRLLLLAVSCPVLAVLGANRLNNGSGDQVSLIALVCITVAVLFLVLWHRQLSDTFTCVLLYPVSLALLLLTSLRGWYVTGHDIQTEYYVFQITKATGHWNIDAFHNAYNACLSLTILPTELSRAILVDDPYIYKFFFQVLFACCPVLAYTIFRRYAPKLIALLAIIYFIGFPTFFTDMPYLNRQEMAFLFVAVGILAVTNNRWPQRVRRMGFFCAALGVEVSHYSTMYLLLGMLIAAWFLNEIIDLWTGIRARKMDAPEHERWPTPARTLGLGSVLVVAVMVLFWGGLATNTSGPLLSDLKTAVLQIGNRSYNAFGSTLNSAQAIAGYRGSALQTIAGQPASRYPPAHAVARYATPPDPEPTMSLTAVGHLFSDLGLSVTALDTDVRQGAAKDEELFLAAGFVALLASRRLRRRVSQEFASLGAASVAMVAAFILLPELSIDYGSLRAFQEALILTAPILVVGSVALFYLFGEKWSLRISAAVCLGIFTSTIGLMPQVLGGYAADLSLNNSGSYYDLYYPHPQDVAAANWLANQPGASLSDVQSSFSPSLPDMLPTSEVLPFTKSLDASPLGPVPTDLYPVLIQRSTWVFLDYALVRGDRAALPFDGQIVSYAYPKGILRNYKNLVYDNGGTEIYK
jgi:uncharacterized membrane protein